MKGLLGTIATAICLFLPSLPMAATQYEAESATRSGGANINTNHPGYTGTGFVDGYFNSTTAQTAFTVSASAICEPAMRSIPAGSRLGVVVGSTVPAFI